MVRRIVDANLAGLSKSGGARKSEHQMRIGIDTDSMIRGETSKRNLPARSSQQGQGGKGHGGKSHCKLLKSDPDTIASAARKISDGLHFAAAFLFRVVLPT